MAVLPDEAMFLQKAMFLQPFILGVFLVDFLLNVPGQQTEAFLFTQGPHRAWMRVPFHRHYQALWGEGHVRPTPRG